MGRRRGTDHAGVLAPPAVGVGAIMALRLLGILAVLWFVAVVWYVVEAGFASLPVP